MFQSEFAHCKTDPGSPPYPGGLRGGSRTEQEGLVAVTDSFLFSSSYELAPTSTLDDSGSWNEFAEVGSEEPLFDLYIYPESGEVVQMRSRSPIPARTRRLRKLLTSTTQTFGHVLEAATPNYVLDILDRKDTAPGRAFNEVRRRVIAAGLGTHARLAYNVPPTVSMLKRDISKFVSRLRKQHKCFPYVAVPERGHLSNALHWHCALPLSVHADQIDTCWIRGSTHTTRMPDYEALENLCSYITKTFFVEDYERDLPHRYKRDRRLIVRRYIEEGLTQAEVEMCVDQLVGDKLSTLKMRPSDNALVVATYRWSPEHLDRLFGQ
jgi:hypothetical protein